MIQLNSKSKLTFIALILIFLISIQVYFHEDQNFLIKKPKIDDQNFPNIVSPTHNNKTTINHLPKFPSNSIDPYKFLHIIPNPDGTITRLEEFFPTIPPSNSINSHFPTLSKDVLLDVEKNTWVRIFLPRKAIRKMKKPEKLPIVLFAHGGGFILFSAASTIFHNFCAELAAQLGALVVSVEYRLAPENRLPAAYEDVFDGLLWLKDGKDEWVKKYGNFSRCVLMGQSAGANIVYNVMLRASNVVNDLKPLNIVGSILIQPAFGGPNRTGAELRIANDPLTPLIVGDLMWALALPVGASRGHEFSDPTIGGGSEDLNRVMDLGWWIVVTGCEGDPLIDRQVHVAEVLKRKGVIVKSLFTKGGYHSESLIDPIAMRELLTYLGNIFRGF